MTKEQHHEASDGLFHRVFDQVAAEYPDIQHEHQIIDIGAARLAAQPEMLDVIATLNLYGDILSDIAAQGGRLYQAGGSANIGHAAAMFEAVTARRRTSPGRTSPTRRACCRPRFRCSCMSASRRCAERIKNAWLCTLEDGIHTGDTYRMGLSQERVGTRAFTDAVIARLDRRPTQTEPAAYRGEGVQFRLTRHERAVKDLVGVDVFLHWDEPGRNADVLAQRLAATYAGPLSLSMITNRGVKVYPEGLPETFRSDHWRCRYMGSAESLPDTAVLALLARLNEAGLDIIKTENLYTFDGEPGYSLGQGE